MAGPGTRKIHGTVNGLIRAPQDLMATESVGFIVLNINGVSAAGVTMTAAQIPEIAIYLQNRASWPALQIGRVNLPWLLMLNDAFFGRPYESWGAVAEAFECQVVFPLMTPGELNALDIERTGDITVEFSETADPAVFDSLFMRISTISIQAPELYLPSYILQRFVLPGAGGTTIEPLRMPNIAYLCLDDASTTDPDYLSVDLVSPRNRVVDHMKWDDLRHLSSLSFKVEAAALAKTVIEINYTRDLLFALANGLELTFHGGAGTIDVLTINRLYSSTATAISVAKLRGRMATQELRLKTANVHIPTAARITPAAIVSAPASRNLQV